MNCTEYCSETNLDRIQTSSLPYGPFLRLFLRNIADRNKGGEVSGTLLFLRSLPHPWRVELLEFQLLKH